MDFACGSENPRGFKLGLVERGLRARLRSDPRFDGGHGGSAEFAELNARVVADNVLRVGQQRQQRGGRRAFDLRPVFHERFARVDDAPDATTHVVPLRIAHGMLGVPDDQTGEIGHVERAVETELHVDGAKRAVFRAEHIEAIGRDERAGIRLHG